MTDTNGKNRRRVLQLLATTGMSLGVVGNAAGSKPAGQRQDGSTEGQLPNVETTELRKKLQEIVSNPSRRRIPFKRCESF